MVDSLERVIIANPKGNAWGFANKVYKQIQSIGEKRNREIQPYPRREVYPQVSA